MRSGFASGNAENKEHFGDSEINGNALRLASVLDLNEASLLHAVLMSRRGEDLFIDASGVERIGTLCVQVLMSGAKTWEKGNLTFRFTKVSGAFSKTLQLIGVNFDHLLAKEIGR